MKKLAIACLLALPAFLNPAFSATEQQNKMGECNKKASDKKGDERKAFMSECLSNKPKTSDAQKAQQEKMKTCNADAKGKTGDERKKFMSECLKKS
jgi:hypothetical protein